MREMVSLQDLANTALIIVLAVSVAINILQPLRSWDQALRRWRGPWALSAGSSGGYRARQSTRLAGRPRSRPRAA